MEKIPRLSPVAAIADVPSERRVPEMIRVPAIDPIVGIVVCDTIFAMPTHYVAGRTRICPGEAVCEHCDKVPMKWYGLIAVHGRNDRQAKWVQLTSQATACLMNEIARRQVPLFGLSVRISRERKVKNAPIVITIDDYAQVPTRMPKALDPQETIERVFGSRDSTRSNRVNPV